MMLLETTGAMMPYINTYATRDLPVVGAGHRHLLHCQDLPPVQEKQKGADFHAHLGGLLGHHQHLGRHPEPHFLQNRQPAGLQKQHQRCHLRSTGLAVPARFLPLHHD